MRFGLISRALVLGASTIGSAAAQNDDCTGALALAPGVTAFDTTGATTLEPWPCAAGGADLWYTYTPIGLGSLVTIDTCGSGFDTALEVLTGVCGALTSVQCNDDFCGLQSSVSFVSAGGTYYVRVGGFASQTGAGALNVVESGPPNDECSGALPLPVGATAFDNTLATTGLELFPCSFGSAGGGADLWYTYTAPLGPVTTTIDTCAGGLDTILVVHSGSCGSLTVVNCNDDTCGLRSSVTFVPVAGATYYVQVGGWNAASPELGPSVLTVAEAVPPPTLDLAITDCLPATFVDISATGTPLNLGDDSSIAIATTVGNALFGAGSVQVGSNGAVRFAGPGTSLGFTNAAIPASGAFGLTSQVLMPLWDDFNTASGTAGNIFWQEIGGTLYVQWHQARFFGSTDSATFQVQVPSSGPALAQFVYTDIESVRASGGSSATIGYQAGGIANDVMHSLNAHFAVRNGTVLSLVNRLAATTYISSSVPGTFIDISGSGAPLNLSDDSSIDIPTTVGNALLAAGTARVGSNGAIRFGGPGASLGFTNAAIPASGAYGLTSQVIMPFWDDFNTLSGAVGNIYWQEIGDTLIVQWHNAGFFGQPATETARFQVQVFKGGPVVAQFLYDDIQGVRAAGGASATIGYQSGGIAGNDVQYSFNSASVTNGTVLSLCYTNAVVGTRYCIPTSNSTGSSANMFGTGSASLAANDLVLNVTDLPTGSFGFFVRGTATANTLSSGGGMGTLCVGGTLARGVGLAIVNSGATGSVSLPALLTTLPTNAAGVTVSATVGQVLWLQYWYRDAVGGVTTTNLSNALQVQVKN